MPRFLASVFPLVAHARLSRCDGQPDGGSGKSRPAIHQGIPREGGRAVLARASRAIKPPSALLKERAAAVRECFTSEEGWTPSVSFAGIRCWYQRDERGRVRVRAEAEVEAPILDLAALFYEVELWHRWAPSFGSLGLQRAGILGAQNPIRLVCFLEANLPWPFRRRTCRFAAEAVDCLEAEEHDPQIVILLDSGRASDVCPDLPDAEDESVRADLLDSGIILTPGRAAGRRGTLVQGVLNIDPHMHLPDWMIAVACTNLCVLVIMQWRRAAHLARSREYTDVTCDPDHPFYSYVRRRLAEQAPEELAAVPDLRRRQDGDVLEDTVESRVSSMREEIGALGKTICALLPA